MQEEDFEGPLDGAVDAMGEGGGVVDCGSVGFACFFLELGGFSGEEDGGVGFLEEDYAGGCVDGGED